MPFVDEEDEVSVDKPNLIISEVPYVTPVAETRNQGHESLAGFTAGKKMAVDYYKQIQRRDSAPASYQDDLPAAYGQYELIRGFELIITDDMSQDQNNSDTGGFALTGGAAVYSIVTPENGDMFIADVGNGRRVMFQVNEPKRGSIYPEANTTISFRGLHWVDAAFAEKINTKRVSYTYVFLRENFRNGVKALLREEEVSVLRRLTKARKRLIAMYFKDHFDDARQTFVVPHPNKLVYDPNVTKFMKSILETTDHPHVAWITELGVGGDVYSNQWSLFDVLARKDIDLLYSCSRRFGFSPIGAYKAKAHFASIYYSGIQLVVSAADPTWSANNNYEPAHAIDPFVKADVRQKDIRSLLPELDLVGDEPAPDYGQYIKRIVVDEYYVFSKEFYEDEPGQSHLERLTRERISGKVIDLNMLADIADYAVKFDNLERFYYIPIILTLIKLAPGVF
jgi:hypothetical protein